MRNERKNHSFPAPSDFHTPAQLENSKKALGPFDQQRIDRYSGMMRDARIIRRQWLEDNLRLGTLPRGEQRELERLREKEKQTAKRIP